jgi:hypothetical protein
VSLQLSSIFLSLASILFFGSAANAQWLCREASSQRIGHTITACGVGQSTILEEARVKSRESAVEEFKRLCQLSTDCFEHEYFVIPKRTDCEFKDGHHICYRALDFEIGDRRRKSVTLNEDELKSDLQKKNDEIQAIQSRIEQIGLIKKSELEMEAKQNELAALQSSLNQKEAEALKLDDLNSKETMATGGYRYLHQAYKNSIKVSFFYWASKLTSDAENDILWMAAYERRPFSWLGIQVHGGFGRGYLNNQKNSDEEVPTQGTAGSVQSFNGTVAYTDLGVAALVYSGWRGTYLKVDAGQINGRKESYLVNYNGSGVGVPRKTINGFSANYLGATLGFDTRDDKKGLGIFFELGARNLSDQSRVGFIGGLGLNYGF